MHKDDYIKIAREYETKGRRVLARELGISEAHLSNVVRKMKAQGVQISLKRQNTREAFKDAIGELTGKAPAMLASTPEIAKPFRCRFCAYIGESEASITEHATIHNIKA